MSRRTAAPPDAAWGGLPPRARAAQQGSRLRIQPRTNATNTIDVSANDGRIRFSRDIGSAAIDLDAVEGLTFHVAGASDTITAHDLTGTDAENVDIDFNTPVARRPRPTSSSSPEDERQRAPGAG